MARYKVDNIPREIDFECNDDALKRTLQNVKNLMMLRKGELPYDRLRGIDPALFDLPITEVNARIVKELEGVMLWEPDVTVVSANAMLTNGDQMVITCIVDTDVE